MDDSQLRRLLIQSDLPDELSIKIRAFTQAVYAAGRQEEREAGELPVDYADLAKRVAEELARLGWDMTDYSRVGCSRCGAEGVEHAKWCHSCGNRLPQARGSLNDIERALREALKPKAEGAEHD